MQCLVLHEGTVLILHYCFQCGVDKAACRLYSSSEEVKYMYRTVPSL
jgi:hypothetical protein